MKLPVSVKITIGLAELAFEPPRYENLLAGVMVQVAVSVQATLNVLSNVTGELTQIFGGAKYPATGVIGVDSAITGRSVRELQRNRLTAYERKWNLEWERNPLVRIVGNGE